MATTETRVGDMPAASAAIGMNVHAIQTGTVAVKTRQRAGTGRGPVRLANTLIDRSWTDPLPIFAWLIEHPEGLIVVDTGETSHVADPGYFPRWQPYFKLAVREWVAPADEIGPTLKALGFFPDDVRWVIMTHLHTDHAGGLSHFPNSEILVHRPEFENASGFIGKARGFLPHRWPQWFAPHLFELDPEPFGPFPRSLRVTEAGDVRIVATHGHTRGHVSVVLEEGPRSVFFAGDASYTEALMLEEAIDGVAPDERSARETLRRIHELTRERPLVYLPSHDPEAANRLEVRHIVTAEVHQGAPATHDHIHEKSARSEPTA
jgi:glyoxylase-like metal-dependent hydrolase (beta-lactamase superfamily II)